MTYRIEKKLSDGSWTSDGLGDADGWESPEKAHEALASLGLLVRSDETWAGTYAVVDVSSGERIGVWELDHAGEIS